MYLPAPQSDGVDVTTVAELQQVADDVGCQVIGSFRNTDDCNTVRIKDSVQCSASSYKRADCSRELAKHNRKLQKTRVLWYNNSVNITYRPELVHPTAYIAPNATIVGEVHIASGASVWFGCVLRGDNAAITVGARTNVQDLTLIHVDLDEPCTLGEGVTVGHRVVLHSATVEDGALIGIGAIVLNGTVVGQEAIVGAGALVPEGMVIPSRHLALGIPARVVRELAPEEVERTHSFAVHYVERARALRAMISGHDLVVNKGG